MSVDRMVELANQLLNQSELYGNDVRELAELITQHFVPNACGVIDPEVEGDKVRITEETPGLYDVEEALAFATSLFRKVAEIKR